MMLDGRFSTARTRQLLAGELTDLELQFVKTIEEQGYQTLGVKSSDLAGSWSYTLGLHDTLGMPELLTVGLPHSTAASAFQGTVELMRRGADLLAGRLSDLIGNVEVVFRPVDPRWTKMLMNSAHWFHAGWDFPVLQMIFPDLAGRFQWEEGFEERFRQPLLQSDAPPTATEELFEETVAPDGRFRDWKFPGSPHTNAFLSKSVHEQAEAITYVSHDADGDWQFLGDSMADGGGPVVVCLHHPIDADESLQEL